MVDRLPEREGLEIRFPVLSGYRLERPAPRLRLPDSLPPYDAGGLARRAPTRTVAEDLLQERGRPAGQSTIIETATRNRLQTVVYELAVRTTEHLQSDAERDEPSRKASLFAQVLPLTREWLERQQLLPQKPADVDVLLNEPRVSAIPHRIASDCVMVAPGAGGPLPVFDRAEPLPGRAATSFRTRLKHRYPVEDGNRTRYSILDGAACHSKQEVALARALDRHADVEAWVRNYKLGWTIPWYNPATTRMHAYEPDFVARLRREHESAPEDLLVIEFKGVDDDDDRRKRDALERWWTPALNRSAGPAGRLWTPVWITAEELIGNSLDAAVGAARKRRTEHDTRHATAAGPVMETA